MASPPYNDAEPTLLNRQRRVRLQTGRLREFLHGLEQEAGRPFTLCLVSDSTIRRYNRRFRGKDEPTDVLAFPDGPPGRGRAGDLLVSVETARRQARRLGHSLDSEIRILAIHGLLHLLGFDHHAPGPRARMARTERRWRRHFGLPEGLIERSKRSFKFQVGTARSAPRLET